jgi:serine/threonine protein kinase
MEVMQEDIKLKSVSTSSVKSKNESEIVDNAAYSGLDNKPESDRYYQSTSNLSEVFAIIESDTAYYFIATYRGTTLQDLITYNPATFSSNMKKSFVIYQLLRAIAGLHSRGFVHGALRASNIFIDENFWVQLSGIEFSINNRELMEASLHSSIPKHIQEESLVMRWVRGDISNYTYLMALNHLAGRREGDPNFHPVLPWVTDFSGDAPEDGLREFDKTKFRLNKGDEQLNFTFDGPIPHHVTDILSDITYYVYLARRTPIPVLCQFVRSKYESNEYPLSIQRLYQWTPDECIPEFYSDPTIFKSIHADMPDLQTPKWASTPEEFIKKHAELLESPYVSSQLHMWIDLTFGCNLTGEGAIEAKNVALPLLAGQESFMKHGIIQLFKDKHPQKGCNWHKSPQKVALGVPQIGDISVNQSPIQQAQTPETSVSQPSKPYTQSVTTTTSSKHLLRDSPSPGSHLSRNRAASVNSMASSETHHTTKSVNTDVAPAALSLNSEPISLPYCDDDLFTEQLVHFEETHNFGVKYAAMNDIELITNPYLPDPGFRYNIDAKTDFPVPHHPFAVAAAEDMRNLGNIIKGIYTAGSAKIVDLDGDFMESSLSGLFETGGGYMSYDIAPSGQISVSWIAFFSII